MSPRPRKASDDAIFLATQRVMTRAGPRDLTLGAIADEAGLTAGALVQRFGSKLGLLRALMARFAGESSSMFAAIRAAHRSPLAALHDYAGCMARMGGSPTMSAANAAGETWEVPNLVVADGSAFPTASGVNPMITIEAIAHLNARRLAARLS